jgi:hypothetical protein
MNLIKTFSAYLLLLVLFELFGCSKPTNVYVIVANIPENKVEKIISIQVGTVKLTEKMNNLLQGKDYKVNFNKRDSLVCRVSIPSEQFDYSTKIIRKRNVSLYFGYYFDDSVARKYVTFDSAMKNVPEKLKIKVRISSW